MQNVSNSDVPASLGPIRRALLLDAMGTLVRLENPAAALSAALAGAGFPNPDDVVAAALATEIAYYRAEHLRGRDPEGLAGLRRDCARVLRAQLAAAPPLDELTGIMLGALRFAPFADAAPLLSACRAHGVAVAVVSDWDCSLSAHLAAIGIADAVDAVVVSAEVGVTKPDPRIFCAALDRVGVGPADALHVGDDPRRDLGGASAAGIDAVLLDRDDRHRDVTRRVATLADVLGLL
jgi:putative hydrolase of the HAD superfamily